MRTSLFLEVIFIRNSLSPGTDRAVFRRTAVQSKAINLGVMTFRGGIRF